MRTPRGLRIFIALFNTAAALGLALYGSSLAPAVRRGDLLVMVGWGAAVAAAVALVAVLLEAPLPGWLAIGYLLWAGLLAGVAFALVFLALAVSLAPVLPRPSGSLGRGLLLAGGTAVAIALVSSGPRG